MLVFKFTSRLSSKNIAFNYKRTLTTSSSALSNKPDFGFMFDIDGVLVRGKQVLPNAKKCFKMLTDQNGNFKVPSIFLTNAGNAMRSAKAAKLTNILGVNINPDQVVMSHSPLKIMKNYHNKRCLISGQGPIVEIAKNLGFKNLITIDELRQYYPSLDVVDHKRRVFAADVISRYCPDIEVICLFGESVRWETNLQLIIDVLMSSGKLSKGPKKFPTQNLPILVCNCDFVWMAEAPMPRFGHGTFLFCLESIYRKLSGRELEYSVIVGKPFEITYYYAEKMLQQHAESIGIQQKIKRLYAVGDNLDTDIYGANIYNKILENKSKGETKVTNHAGDVSGLLETYAESISSILVRTGVFQDDPKTIGTNSNVMNLAHKNTIIDFNLVKPKHVTQDVLEAVQLVFQMEKF